MSSRLFQSVITQMRDATDRTIGVIDADGMIIACVNQKLIGEKLDEAAAKLRAGTATFCIAMQKTFKILANWNTGFEYAVFADGTDETARTVCLMATVALNEAKSSYEERHDKTTFVKNIITDNFMPGDIYIRAKELHFNAEAQRVVYLVRQIDRADVAAVDVLRRVFPDKQQDFVVSVNETDVAVVRQVHASITPEEIFTAAEAIEQAIAGELQIKTVIGIGSIAAHLRDLANAYKEAQVAIEVGKVFNTEKSVIHYENLGIGRLIYQLPTTLCDIFLSEVFKKNSIDSLDQETLFTINKFFENNLNVSETSRRLFVHRNTLVYRLEKIKKLTGLDLREFDDAIIFKVALMVKKYLDSRENPKLR